MFISLSQNFTFELEFDFVFKLQIKTLLFILCFKVWLQKGKKEIELVFMI